MASLPDLPQSESAIRLPVGRPPTLFGKSGHRLVEAMAVLLALIIGWIITTDVAFLVFTAIAALILSALAVWLFRRDAPAALVAFWFLQLLVIPASAIVGYKSNLGASIRQANDVVAALFLVLTIWSVAFEGKTPRVLWYVLPGCGVAAIGVLSSIAVQASPAVTLQGGWLALKLWALSAICLCVSWSEHDMRRVIRAFLMGGCLVALIAVADYVSHGTVSHTLHTNVIIEGGTGYRPSTVTAPFATPADLSLCMSLLFGIAVAAYAARNDRRYLWAALLFMVAVALSLRLKGVVSVGAVLVIVLACRMYAKRARIAGILAISAILALVIVFYEGEVVSHQIGHYTAGASAKNPRGLLYRVGNEIADDNFPLGAGFGRFGSYTSGVQYSSIYTQYGLSGVSGLLPRTHTVHFRYLMGVVVG